MKIYKLLFLLTIPALSVFSPISNAAIDLAAEQVAVSKTCLDGNGNAIDDCFTTMQSLATWMEGTRKPNANSPLIVNIGPGTFGNADIHINCNPGDNYTGHTSFKGSGIRQTVLRGTGSGSTSPLNITDCTELNFSDLQITTSFYGGVYWGGGGNSTWSNIEIISNGRAWAETICGAEQGQHHWFSSRLVVTTVFTVGVPYRAHCDETWFYGSEIVSITPPNQNVFGGAAVKAIGDGIIHLYGSNLRSFMDGNGSGPAARAGDSSQSGGEIHIHGTGIDVVSNTGKNVVALKAENGGFIHADSSAYVLETTGTKTRIENAGGTVKASFQWSGDNEPPQIASQNGSDIAVETNCDPSGCHAVDTGIETHLLVYNDNCNIANHGPWFDVVTGKCRGDLSQ